MLFSNMRTCPPCVSLDDIHPLFVFVYLRMIWDFSQALGSKFSKPPREKTISIVVTSEHALPSRLEREIRDPRWKELLFLHLRETERKIGERIENEEEGKKSEDQHV